MSLFNARSFKRCCIIAATLLLLACSAVKLAYNQAPSLAYWYVDSYFDLNEQQSPVVRAEIDKLLAWHRSSELPKYAALLQKAQNQLPQTISSAQACALAGEVRGFFEAAVDRAIPGVAEVAPTLIAAQLARMAERNKKNNAQYRKDYLDAPAADQLSKRTEEAIERSERVYGKLDEAQRALVKSLVEKSGFNPVLGLKERERRQNDTLLMLRSIANPVVSTPVVSAPAASAQTGNAPAAGNQAGNQPAASVQAQLRSIVARNAQSADPAFRAYADAMLKESCDAFATIHASTSSTQRANAVQTLKSYETDFRTLAANR